MNSLKKLIYSILLGGIVFSFSACTDYLDVSGELSDNLTTEEVFKNPAYTKRWHANIFNCIPNYSEMGMGATTGFTGIWNILAGEVTTAKGTGLTEMTSGYNASSASFPRWWTLYKYIRQAMVFVENARPLGNDGDKEQINDQEMNRMKAEANFFMAYSYFLLFEVYGPVPIVEKIADPDDRTTDYNRATVDEMVNYIDKLLKDVIESGHLPETLFTGVDGSDYDHNNNRYDLENIVRPTKVAAMALRARLAVYAASPLFNGGYPEALEVTNKDGKRLFPDKDDSKWNTAKTRLEELLRFTEEKGFKLYHAKPEANGSVDPHKSVYELYQFYNDEILWANGNNNYNSVSTNMEPRTTPRDIYSGFGNVGIFQESIDAFFMNNGLEINDQGSGYKEDGFVDLVNVCSETLHKDKHIFNMYANREPRFYAAVTYEGKSWHKNINTTTKKDYGVYFSKDGGADNSASENPRTGYMLYKFKNRSLLNTGTNTKQWGRPWILFRLADFYLYYAEVCNEIDPGDANIIKYLDLVRERAGIAGYTELAAKGKKNIIGDQSLQRRAIQRERQIELFAEGNRYFDIHRWMICDDANGEAQQLIRTGMDMTSYAVAEFDKNKIPISFLNKIGKDSYYNRVVIEYRAWRRAMLLYPIPYNEVQKSRLIVQNPLWN